jgi:macrodomain Ter protein organizer (MatP/YcbG family)
VKTTITAHISIDRIAWRRVQDLAARQGRALPEVLGELLDEASTESPTQNLKSEVPYEPPSLLRLWLRSHPDTVVERD